MPIIDTHIHLFDPTRPQGVPWPEKTDAVLYKPALTDRYRKIAVPLGITGAIEVEASPWLEDNQWVLDIAARDPIIVGTVGDLEPGKPDFGKHLDRFHRNPLFRRNSLWESVGKRSRGGIIQARVHHRSQGAGGQLASCWTPRIRIPP